MLLKNITTPLTMLLAMAFGTTSASAGSLASTPGMLKRDPPDFPRCSSNEDCISWGMRICDPGNPGFCRGGYDVFLDLRWRSELTVSW
ncbi:hypothetical protein B0T25DRAFT_618451 [Lasiosphaeria hispida]|uniref:Uncharacterized protein n=1 Tax=Lasiosphaeria hispida TaxID=260671 RepID=A0AAJ0M7S4_9PEZI|nr:hypothetical protein B0T25DRAFT_618451 [Lasiosphaeria hispida]